MITRVDHLGLAVHSLAEARGFYEKVLGLPCLGVEEVPSQKVRCAFFKAGETNIELLEPTSPESPIAGFLEKRGEGIHHVAYAVDDIAAQLDRARAEGAKLINETPVAGAHGKLVAFVHPKASHGVLTEFCCSPG